MIKHYSKKFEKKMIKAYRETREMIEDQKVREKIAGHLVISMLSRTFAVRDASKASNIIS